MDLEWNENQKSRVLETVDYSDSTSDVSYGYDRLGRKTNAVQGATSLEFRYNDAGRLLSETFVGGPLDGVTVTNTYDALLRQPDGASLR